MNLGRKILWKDFLPSLLSSMFEIGGYRKHIQKLIRNKMVPFYIFVVTCWKNSGQKLITTQMEEDNYYQKNANYQYYTQQPNKTKGYNGSQMYKDDVSLVYMILKARLNSSETIVTDILVCENNLSKLKSVNLHLNILFFSLN